MEAKARPQAKGRLKIPRELTRVELGNPALGSKFLHFPTQYPQSLLVQCLACLWKQHWSYWRNPPYTAVRFLSTTVTAVLFGTMFWDLGGK